MDVAYFSPEQEFTSPYPSNDSQALVFTGAMDYWANVDAVKWFAEQVFPQVVKQLPKAKFYIVGSKPTKDVLVLANEHVIVTARC